MHLGYFRVLYCGYCQVLAVFRPFVLRVLEVSKDRILSICAVKWRILRPSVHGFDNLVPFSLHKAFTDDPASVRFARVATNSYFRGGAPGVLGVLAVFTGSILLILWSTTSISDVCTAGTACTRGSVLLMLPLLAGTWAISTSAHILSTRIAKRARHSEYSRVY